MDARVVEGSLQVVGDAVLLEDDQLRGIRELPAAKRLFKQIWSKYV